MFNDNNTYNDNRSNSALLVSMRAREVEKKLALQMGELRAEQAAASRKSSSSFGDIVTKLLTSLHLI